MDYVDIVVFIIEIIGTIAFAVSGAMVGINRKMDVFGVSVLGVTTAVGGGMIRDISLNMVPNSLLEPVYIQVSIITTLILFIAVYFSKVESKGKHKIVYDNVMMAMDSVGLGIFTAVGVAKGISNGYVDNTLLLVFLGTITGVGGGLLRDVMAGVQPYIFKKHIYACASMIGAFVYIWTYIAFGEIKAMIFSTLVVVVIRYFARHYKWNLPRIIMESEDKYKKSN